LSNGRADRVSGRTADKPGEFRSPFQRDYDRILYSGAFRRLAVVRQVVSPAGGHAFHNRLTHALKVAQVGRRIAEKLLATEDKDLVESFGGISPDVVEAAGLAHDLGHPPFGHIAEETLDKLLCNNKEPEGYEGNAQSFRIATRLETREAAGDVVSGDIDRHEGNMAAMRAQESRRVAEQARMAVRLRSRDRPAGVAD